MYQVIGVFADESSQTVCWGGKTSSREVAEERLQEAEEYEQRQAQFNGQPIEWGIVQRNPIQQETTECDE